ncbi:MAG: hypothetical protein KGI08_05210 [Thaumarchaeota archaeon]|nr:hypothetical protein [Nitrososphaerota archaeon]
MQKIDAYALAYKDGTFQGKISVTENNARLYSILTGIKRPTLLEALEDARQLAKEWRKN